MSKEFDFYLKSDLRKYEGKYIVVVDDKVVASGDNAKTILDQAQEQYPHRLLSLAKVPKEGTYIFIQWK